MTAYVLMTALPPTKGHIKLMEYASCVDEEVCVIVCTQPDEPFAKERYLAVREHARALGQTAIWLNEKMPQDPATPGFRELWQKIMQEDFEFLPSDYLVASEPYGQWLAEMCKGTFIPYDPERCLHEISGTKVREDPLGNFPLIAEGFQRYLQVNVVLFGAESTGKTTLAKDLASSLGGWFFPEWARPYLEMVGPEIDVRSMTSIWTGQQALEEHARGNFHDRPYRFFDTDLYSTIGYWELPHWFEVLGQVPEGLVKSATKADLYLITPSNIPFEADPLRYGGSVREASDEYWINVADRYKLPYVILESSDRQDRLEEARYFAEEAFDERAASLYYDRGGF